MPAQLINGVNKASSKKRKRTGAVEKTRNDVVKKAAKSKPSTLSAEDVLEVEEAIVESPQNYNKIVSLLEYLHNLSENPELAVTSAVSLCRVFCRLMAKGNISRRKEDDEAQATIVAWLKDRYKDYINDLCKLLDYEDPAVQTTALTLLMRLIKEDATHMKPTGDEFYFPHVLFGKVVKALIYAESLDESIKQEFITKYLNEFDDVRYAFYIAIPNLTSEAVSNSSTLPHFTSAALSLILSLNSPPTSETPLLSAYYVTPSSSKKPKDKQPAILQKSSHRKALQEAWLSLLRLPLSKENTKSLLLTMSNRIVPTFPRPQLLMDFLVDAYTTGGTISLLALNGLFYLISTKNLDYPNFYPALYALLTRDVLHVRYRSRFFRLLDTFLASTHLPAALIASFIKKLARLSLSAPPSAVVVIVPFIYNLLKKHPSCTFMVHREGSTEDRERWRKEGLEDCFDEKETDPMKTGAIDSSLWEVEMGMTHWQPNVATLCRIIGEQFTKERYGLEDFLDHSYASMFNAEIQKNIKKPPVVEFDIPKKIFFKVEAELAKDEVSAPKQENTLLSLWSFE